jgi:parallel beta-helix repeat protein
MKNKHFICLICLIFSLRITAQVYVSASTGVDASGRGSQAMPYKSISFAVGQAAASSTVYVAVGTYNETSVIYIDKSLTLVKNGAGSVIVNGNYRVGTTDTYMIAIVNGASNVTIDGLMLQNNVVNDAIGIWSRGFGNNITIQNCTFTNIGWISNDLVTLPPSSSYNANAIRIEGVAATPLTNVFILNNDVSNCATGWSEAVTIGGNVDGFTVDNNRVHHIANIGIDATGNYRYNAATVPADKDQARNGKITNNEVYNCMSGVANSCGIYLDGALNCTVERNKCYNNGVGVGLGGEENVGAGVPQPSGHKIRNNLIYNNCVTGMFLGTNNATNSIQNTTVYNNTFYKNRTGQPINGITAIGGQPLSFYSDDVGGEVSLQNINGVAFKNNVVYPINGKKGLITYSGYTVSGFVSDYNVYYRDNTAAVFALRGVSFNGLVSSLDYNTIANFNAATGLEANSVFLNPGFTNGASNNFTLTNTASAINTGDPNYDATVSGTTDFAGNTRKIGSRIDGGAYENQSALPVTFAHLKAYPLENGVRIEWTTASEVNNSYFEVLKSVDGQAFTAIGTVKSAVEKGGSKTALSAYAFIDNAPNDGVNYYRIRQVDWDGKSELTAIVAVDIKANAALQLFPNLTNGRLTLMSSTKGEYHIFDIFGHKILRGNILDKQTTIDVSFLPPSVYFLRMDAGVVQFTKY